MKRLFILFSFLFLSINIYSQMTIDSVRINDSTGVPKKVNKFVTVYGIVTSTTDLGTNGPASLQDQNAGIAVFGSSFAGSVHRGDSVKVVAPMTNYYGLAEMNYSLGGSFYQIFLSGHALERK